MAEDPKLLERPTTCLESLLVEGANNGQTTDDALFGSIITMLLAGEDTTAHTISWIVYYLSLNPSVLKALGDETSYIMADQEHLNWGQLNQLPYMEAVIQETLRLKPVAPLLYLTCLKDTIIDNVQIHKGASLITLGEYAGKRSQYFQDAAIFNPQRWLTPEQFQTHSPDTLIP